MLLLKIFQVARSVGDLASKSPLIGGVNGTIVHNPCVNKFQINDKSDFILLGCKINY